eukprot:COSAG02_NODE_1056_length_14925_cov_84.064212_5_plen_605_part_00
MGWLCMAGVEVDVNAENVHTIEQRSTPSSPPSTPSKADEVLYCHFIPKKEFVEKGTPWIIHTTAKCYVCSTVNFESMAMMRTAGPGGEAPDPVVCKCGVSRHHLRLEGYVTMSQENTPHPVATIRSHRQSTLANIPAMEQKLKCLESDIKDLTKKNKTQALKLKANHEDHSKLRSTNNDWKKKLADREEKLSSAQTATRAVQAKLQQKELLVNEMTQQLQSLRESSGNGGGRAQRKQQEKAAAAKQEAKQKLCKLQAEASIWKAKAESQGAARGRLEATVQDLRQQLENTLAKVGKSASRLPSQEGTNSQEKTGCHDNEIGQKSSQGSADAGESDTQDVSTDSELDPVVDADRVLIDSKTESSVAEDVTCDDTAAADTAPPPAHVEEDETEKRVELDVAAVEEKLMSPRDSAGVDSNVEAGERAGAGASTQIGTRTSLQLDGAPVQLARSGPPATLGGSSLTRRPAATTLDGRGVTAADMMRQAQQRRAANMPSSGKSQPTVAANISSAAKAGTGATWSTGRSSHGLAGAGAIGLRGPSSIGANLHGRPQAMKNWGGNPFGSAGAASSKQTPSLAVLGSPAAGGANSTWTPIVAGGLQFRGRRR